MPELNDKELENEWRLALAGGLSICLGIRMIFWPATTTLIMAWIIGICAIIYCGMTIMLGLRARRCHTERF